MGRCPSLVLGVLLIGILLPAGRSVASVFNYLTAPVEVSPAAGSWQTVNVATWVPPGATGVILQMENTSNSTHYQYAVRKNGSTDTWMQTGNVARKKHMRFFMIGLDESRNFECFTGDVAVKTYLVGYTMPGVTFFTNAVDKSVGTAGSYQDVDISGDTGTDTAIGGIFIVTGSSALMYSLREKGSTDSRYTDIQAESATGAWVGVDGSELCEMRIETTDVDLYLVGYVTQGAVFFTNAADKSAASSGSYVDTDITPQIGTDVANGALVEFSPTDNKNKDTGIRPNGESYDYYRGLKHNYAAVRVDSGNRFEQKVFSGLMDCYLAGYTLYEPDINYRSIGTNAATLYSTGTASITIASSVMTFGGGASLPGNIGQGDEISIGGDTLYIMSRDSATQVTIQGFSPNTHTNAAYTIQRAYNSPQAWEDDRQGDLVADGRREVGVGYDDGPFASLLYLQGSTTDAEHYMHLTVAPGHRHNGIAGNGVRIDAGGGLGNVGIRVLDDYTRVDWWEITGILDGYACVNPTSGAYSRFEYLLIHDFGGSPTSRGIHCNEVGIIVRNCIVYDGPTADVGIRLTGFDTIVENCTVYGIGGDGIRQYAANTSEIRNTIAVGNGTDFDCLGTLNAFDYNMYSTTDGGFTTGANDQSPPSDLESLFISIVPGSENLRLEMAGNLALDNGVDLSSDFTTDINGETRVAPWDIGADWSPVTVSYRSIGTNAATLYSAGTASITAGSRTVTFGGGASLPTNVGQGDELVIGGETLYIYTRDSATQVGVQGVAAATHTNAGYTIKRSYNDLQDWENDRGTGNFVITKKKGIGVAYNDGPFTNALAWNYTGAGEYNMTLTVAPGHRHNGTPGSGVILDASSIAGTDVISINSSGQVLEWFEITNIPATFDAIQTATGVVGGYTFSHLLIHDGDAGAGIRIRDDGTVRNCMIYGSMDFGIRVSGSGTVATIENCTVYGATLDGVHSDIPATPTDVTVRNTLSVNSGGEDFDLRGTITYFGYNMYATTVSFDPASYQGGNQSPPADLEDLFVSIAPGSENLHLENGGHAATDTGLDLSADFSLDIDGQARSWPWDIGADWNAMSVNYRSIGTDAGVIYSTGNASINPGERVVTFAGGADLPTNIGAGDVLSVGGENLYIVSRDSSTQVSCQYPAVLTHTSEAYTIKRAYNTLQAWEDARDGDLAGDNRREIGVCYNDGWFTDRLVISGSTTDVGHFMTLTVAAGQRHNGVRNTGAGINAQGGWTGQDAITVEDEYTRIEHLEIKDVFDSGDAIFFDDSPAADNGTVIGVFVHGFWQNSNAAVRTAAPNTTIRNCFITGGTTYGIHVGTGGGVTVENCTLWGSAAGGHGLYAPTGSITARNTISVNHGGYDFYIETAGSATIGDFGYNLFSTHSGGFDPNGYSGNNQWPPQDLERLFKDTSTPDLHLETTGHYAGNNGLDLSATFTDDIDGATRVDAWDIGADEGVSGTEELDPKVIRWAEVKPQ